MAKVWAVLLAAAIAAAATAPELVQSTDLPIEMAPCAASLVPFAYNYSDSTFVSGGWPGGQCVTARCRRLPAGSGEGPVALDVCGARLACQAWSIQPNGTITSGGLCLQSAPRLELSACASGSSQQWELGNGTVRQKGGRNCIAVVLATAPRREALALERPPPAPSAVSSPLGDACTGSSLNLAAVQCTAWASLYDGTGGATQWTGCKANRLDPCNCSYVYSGTRGVTCSADGQHILKL
jgi:hypothetical protein